MLRTFLGSRHKPHGSTQSLNALEESQQIEDAMGAATLIMNDDVEGAERGLDKGNSSFHKLGKGVVVFMRATLGFEQDVMKEASERLADAESSAYEQQRKAQRHPHTNQSTIYPAGTEYSLILAETQLMSAVVGVLNESLTESIKGFYKLRKAYIALDGILASEAAYVKGQSSTSVNSASLRPLTAKSSSSSLSKKLEAAKLNDSLPNGAKDEVTNQRPVSSTQSDTVITRPITSSVDDSEKDEFFEADVDQKGSETPKEYAGHLDLMNRLLDDSGTSHLGLVNTAASKEHISASPPPAVSTVSEREPIQAPWDAGPDADLFGDNPVDVFIHSGSNLCFGILLVMISLIPPAFAMLLKIVGFKGDLPKGLSLLWQATKFNNINGAMAGLVLFGYYNGLVGFCDILPRQGEGSYPRERLKELLTNMRTRYPGSHLWLLEESRMLAGEKQLEKAVKFINEAPKSALKQVEALQCFERSLDCMYLHDYEACAESFIKCTTLNNWSHGLYYYIAGSCHVELYRSYKTSEPERAAEHSKKAVELLMTVRKHTGKKRFMARQLPFDAFVDRKVQKWEHRATQQKCEFIDAIGVAPVEEMIYFWNGYKRMRTEHLEESLRRLAWSKEQPGWDSEPLDEKSIEAVLRATTLKYMGQSSDAKAVLKDEIITHPWADFKGHLHDTWPCPVAHYEMAANLWQDTETPESQPEQIMECSSWLEKAAGWESYELDARMGMKITTARDTLRRYDVSAVA